MSRRRVRINESTLERVAVQAVLPIQAEADGRISVIVERFRQSHAGRPVDEIEAGLRSEIGRTLAEFTRAIPNETNLRLLVEEISRS